MYVHIYLHDEAYTSSSLRDNKQKHRLTSMTGSVGGVGRLHVKVIAVGVVCMCVCVYLYGCMRANNCYNAGGLV